MVNAVTIIIVPKYEPNKKPDAKTIGEAKPCRKIHAILKIINISSPLTKNLY